MIRQYKFEKISHGFHTDFVRISHGLHTDFIRISHGLEVFKNLFRDITKIKFHFIKLQRYIFKNVILPVLDFAPPVALFIGQFAFDTSSVRFFSTHCSFHRTIRVRYLISPTPAVKLEVLQGASALPSVSLYFSALAALNIIYPQARKIGFVASFSCIRDFLDGFVMVS